MLRGPYTCSSPFSTAEFSAPTFLLSIQRPWFWKMELVSRPCFPNSSPRLNQRYYSSWSHSPGNFSHRWNRYYLEQLPLTWQDRPIHFYLSYLTRRLSFLISISGRLFLPAIWSSSLDSFPLLNNRNPIELNQDWRELFCGSNGS